MRLRWVAAISLVFTYLFFFEYLPPFRWVDVPYDLQYFHYSLDDFAFQSLRAGHIPEWDAHQYCGMTFVGNAQTALFYPPMWLVFLANHGRERLQYRSLEILVLGHVWLAFLFCFIWLRNRELDLLACLLGASIFAYSGYVLEQLSHLGLVCGYAWLPIGLWSIDQAAASSDWRDLWKLALASSLCFLAGYPPTWFVFAVCMLAYAAFRPQGLQIGLWAGGALVFSLLIAMVQFLPTMEAATFRGIQENYGSGTRDPAFFISYFVPNYFDFRITSPGATNPGYQYLYLGAPAFFGLAYLIWKVRAVGGAMPVLALGVVSFLLVNNPFDIVWSILKHFKFLAQICRSYYFLAGLTLCVSGLAAIGIDQFLKRIERPGRPWVALVTTGAVLLWGVRQIWIWRPSGPGFATGLAGAIDPTVTLGVFSLAMFVIGSETGRRRLWLTVALLLGVGIDYKVFGTSNRLNASRENVDRFFASAPFPGLNDAVYRKLREAPEARIALDSINPLPSDLRHYGLSTPQGGDPLVPAQYSKVLPPVGTYYGFLLIEPGNRDLLQLLGVRYFLTSEGQPQYERLLHDSGFRELQPANTYFKVFEFLPAKAPYRWETSGLRDWIHQTEWHDEERRFSVLTESGGRFVLIEQLYPGWRAKVDGRPVAIERWHDAFQSIAVPPGEHQVWFTFRSDSLRAGAAVSFVSLIGLALSISKLRFARRHVPRGQIPLQV